MLRMRFSYRNATWAAVLALSAGSAIAQVGIGIKNKWMSVGSLHSWYSSVGCEIEEGRIREQQDGLQWPALYRNQDMEAAKGLWLGVRNWTDPAGNAFPYKVVHCGPRVQGLGPAGDGGFFPTKFELVSRYDFTYPTVDGVRSASRVDEIDRIDPTIKSDRMIINEVNTSIGITMTRKILAFSQQFHDGYIVYEYEFKNTGNVDDDAEIELPNQTIDGFYAFFQYRYAISKEGCYVMGNSSRWGINTMNDTRGDGVRPDPPGENVRAQFAYHGRYPNFTRYDNLGAPIWDTPFFDRADTVGRLAAAQFIGVVTIHADRSATDRTNDPDQPRTTTFKGSDDPLNSRNDQFNIAKMTDEYNWMREGHANPRHADLVQPDGNFTQPTGDPSLGTSGGWSSANGYGPYTLAPGQSIRLVMAEAAGGLNREKQVSVGRRYKRGEINARTKNDSVFTSKDSLFRTFTRAIANYQANYATPLAPLPPKNFSIVSGGDKITLTWDVYEADPNLDGFRVYRTRGRYDADTVVLLGSVPASARSFVDTGAVRGFGYYYHVLSVGKASGNTGGGGTPAGIPLVSNRIATQTYDPAFLLEAPGPSIRGVVPDNLSAVRIVPNPFVAGGVTAFGTGQENDIQFRGIPGYCKISIYTEIGELIKEIVHDDGSGLQRWNGTTSSNQLLVSGLYIAVIEDTRSGGKTIQKFVVIR
jgi:hypothetical protein